VETNFS